MTPEEWESFVDRYRRRVERFAWAWTVALVLFAATVIWRFGS